MIRLYSAPGDTSSPKKLGASRGQPVAGVYAILSPIWTTTIAAATGTLILLGIIIVLTALASLVEPGR